jgi:prepilin-type N-terminal cleavage/methylation domain-containing protein
MKKKCFTLVELMVAVAIFGILTVAIAQFLSSFLVMKFNAETLQRMRQEGNAALDQIDYFIRNGLTVPDICTDENENPLNLDTRLCNPDAVADYATNCNPNGSDNDYPNCCYQHFRSNTQGSSENNIFFQRNLVTLETTKDNEQEYGSLVVYQPKDPLTKHSFTTGSFDDFITASIKTALTSTLIGSTGASNFNVHELRFYCLHDPFTNGNIVHTEFKITYQRKTLGTDAQVIEEQFSRDTAVRNDFIFEL